MAELTLEFDFTAGYWHHAFHDTPEARRVAELVEPGMLEDPALRAIYGYILHEYMAGRPVAGDNKEFSKGLLRAVEPVPYGLDTVDRLVPSAWYIDKLGERIRDHWVMRWQVDTMEEQLLASQAALAKDDYAAAKKVAERAVGRMLRLHRERSFVRTPSTRSELVEAELRAMQDPVPKGIAWPYPLLQHEMGHIMPGRVYGISGYPGNGKTTFLCNLFVGWQLRNVPCLVAPTEMLGDWFRRAWTILARYGAPAYDAALVVGQEMAENQQWHSATPEQVEAYQTALQTSEELPWEPIQKLSLSLDELFLRAKVLRRKWSGQHILLLVDNMHNMEYPDGDADKHVGEGTRRLVEFCQSDTEGGMSAVALFQPRKPPTDIEIYRAVRAHQASGKNIWPHLAGHMSPYRRPVKTTPTAFTPWGTPSCLWDPQRGVPELGELGAKDSKVDDENVYVSADKRRVGGGESGRTMVFGMEAPTGWMYERAPQWRQEPAPLVQERASVQY